MAYINLKKVLQVVKTQTAPAVYQTKTITPQNQQHEITADAGFQALSKVILNGLLVDPHESYTTQTDSTVAYTKTVPAGALTYASLDKLGGMSYKCNNLVNKNNSLIGYSINSTTGETFVSNVNYCASEYIKVKPHTTYTFSLNNTAFNIRLSEYSTNATSGHIQRTEQANSNFITITTTATTNYVKWSFNYDNALATQEILNNINMSLLEGTSTTYEPYFEGIRDSAVTSVVSEETLTIPAEVQALTGYGWGINSSGYNYIDLETKKFIQKVDKTIVDSNTVYAWISSSYNACTIAKIGSREAKVGGSFLYVSSNTNINSISTPSTGGIYIQFTNAYTSAQEIKDSLIGTIIYNELLNPSETDISSYIDTNFIEVEPNGTITFNNTYEQGVPSEVTYLVEV